MCEQLNNSFKTKISKPEAYAQLMNIRQENRNITDFAGLIESAAADLSEVIPELTEQTSREKLLISIFMNGLSQNFKRLLIAVEHEEFADLVRAAKRCELALGEHRRVGAVEQVERRREMSTDCRCTDSCGCSAWRDHKAQRNYTNGSSENLQREHSSIYISYYYSPFSLAYIL